MKKINHKHLSAFLFIHKEFYYKLAYSYVHNKDEALHIIQASIGKAFRTIKKLYNPLALKSWFYQIIVDTSIDYLNDKKRFIMVKPEEGIVIPEELEMFVIQTIEEIENKTKLKKLILFRIISVVAMLIIIAYFYTYIEFSL